MSRMPRRSFLAASSAAAVALAASRRVQAGILGGAVALTFDDGFRNQYTNAFPVLQAQGVKGTFYITTGLLSRTDYMTPTHLLELDRNSHEIGGHCVRHESLTSLSTKDARYQVVECKRYLESLLGKTIASFAYPNGAYNDTVVSSVRRAGFQTARTTSSGFAVKTDPYRLRVFNCYNTTTLSAIQSKIDESKTKGLFLIVVNHQIVSSPSNNKYSVTTAFLDYIITYCKGRSVPIMTLRQGFNVLT